MMPVRHNGLDADYAALGSTHAFSRTELIPFMNHEEFKNHRVTPAEPRCMLAVRTAKCNPQMT